MRKWWTRLGIMAASLGICAGSASAQFGPPPGGGMMGPPPGGGMMGPPPGGMMGPPPGGFGMPPGMAPGVMTGGPPTGAFGGAPPGAFGGGAAPGGMPADFPNAAQPSQEPVSPFTVKDEGMPNAFTELNTPRRPPEPYALTFRGEYIGWHLSNGPINVPLVTTTTATPSFQSFGQLGNAGTAILVNSGNTIDYGFNSGFRLTTGVAIGYLPPIEFSGFYINHTATVFSGGSLTNPTQFLAIPFQDVQSAFIIPGTNVGTETASVISIPVGSAVGAQGGTISITSQLTFWGTEANVLVPINDADALRISLIGGYRHLQLNENLNINTASGALSSGALFNGLAQPSSIFSTTTNDFFGTTNAFDGGQFGVRGVLTFGQWSLFSDVKLGLGETAQTLTINGTSTLNQTTPGRNSTAQGATGGILALPTNSTNLTAREFTIVPEVNLSLSFQFTPAIRGFAGYDFLYWSRVARPGDAISGTIDSRQIPTSANFTSGINYNGPFAPAQIQQRSFIAQGIFIGMEIGF